MDRQLRTALAALIAAVAAAAALPGNAAGVRDACPTTGETITTSPTSRLFRIDTQLYGCWEERGIDWPLGSAPAEIDSTSIAGRFAAWSHAETLAPEAPGAAVHLADLHTGKSVAFSLPGATVQALIAGSYGRVAWISSQGGAYEVHRGDLAHRDRLLDSGPGIRPESLRVSKGKLRWRNGRKLRDADFDGSRGDKPPLDEPRLAIVPGSSEVYGRGPIEWRFAIEVEEGLPISHQDFAAAIERILFDPRGWLGPGSRITLQRVDEPPFDFRVTLAAPRTVDRLCLPLHTGGRVSCENRGRSVLNWLRWSTGSPHWTSKSRYRNYLVNHEVGHSLGHGHRFCGGAGQVAPVMQQQTGPATPCIHAQWPKRAERGRSGRP
jgi:hypothetical protein